MLRIERHTLRKRVAFHGLYAVCMDRVDPASVSLITIYLLSL